MIVEGLAQRDVVVTFTKHWASYNPGERACFHDHEAQELVDQGVADMDDATPPANVTVPFVTQAGPTLTCTMGEWSGEPTAYAYQWNVGGTDVGTDAPAYDFDTAEIGQPAICTVTATNAAGSAAAPPSDPHVITDPGSRR